ncbi:MAG TPA: hypothetical protein VGS21_04760 [Acidimicrobiales bacterium]|nr:hypothetical protein [Acidimicrobiales bacterium]
MIEVGGPEWTRSIAIVSTLESATPPRLSEVAPDLANELTEVLDSMGEGLLAASIVALRIHAVDACGDDFCSSFYVGPKPLGGWRREGDYRCVPLVVATGMVNLDVVDESIRFVEVIDRPDVEVKIAPIRGRPRTS